MTFIKVLNSTTNFVLEEIAKCKSYDEVIKDGMLQQKLTSCKHKWHYIHCKYYNRLNAIPIIGNNKGAD